jgi:hypothetical protein
MIMITWAALIVLQAVKGGYGEEEDLPAIHVHLGFLKRGNEPAPSLRRKLADRLESRIHDVQRDTRPSVQFDLGETPDLLHYDWSLFNEASLQGVDDLWCTTGSDL